MPSWLKYFYTDYVIRFPKSVFLFVLTLIVIVSSNVDNFRMDASADSLVLENDQSLEYYRKVKKKYGTDDYLFVTFSPKADLFSKESIKQLTEIRNKIDALPEVEGVISLIDAPIFNPETVSLGNIEDDIYFVKNEGVNLAQAKKDFLSIPLYVNLLISEDGKTTALQANLKGNINYFKLNDELRKLQWKQHKAKLSPYELAAMQNLRSELRILSDEVSVRNAKVINAIRDLKVDYEDTAKIYLGGIPMIAHDMVEFVKSDLVTFGIGVFIILIIIQAFIFRRFRWVVITLGCCVITAVTAIGVLGWLDWPVTVISSNFVALLVIITMSLMIHLIVRFRQVERDFKMLSYEEKVLETVTSMFTPCAYSTLTTIVAFGSLMVSDIRPVGDFGKMMIMGVSLAFVIAFTLFPLLMLIKKKTSLDERKQGAFYAFTNALAFISDKWRWQVAVIAVVLSAVSAWGIGYLSVDNRFIDYFKADTEIYQGMKVIDTELGGTTPLEIIIERGAIEADFAFIEEEDADDEEFADEDFDDEEFDESEGFADVGPKESPRLWMTSFGIQKLHKIQNYLSSLSVTGKVLSLSAGIQIIEQINGNKALDDFQLSLLEKKIPEDLRNQVLSPFYDRENDEVRFLIRVKESDPDLNRNQLLAEISEFLINEVNISRENFHFTGMLILYNNMLESLFESQILTLGVVFGIILLMFIVLFQSWKLAIIGMFPNFIGAFFVLGLMGWSGIPLDMMTITIAAISIGIAVDNTIHYIHRFKSEYKALGDYTKAMYACHDTIARAMYFTSITIISGFSVLILSNFMPSIYFGLFTSLAMIVALLANLTLLPVMLLLIKPLDK